MYLIDIFGFSSCLVVVVVVVVVVRIFRSVKTFLCVPTRLDKMIFLLAEEIQLDTVDGNDANRRSSVLSALSSLKVFECIYCVHQHQKKVSERLCFVNAYYIS